MGIFDRDWIWYGRQRMLSPIPIYTKALSFYLSKVKNKPIEECEEYVKTNILPKMRNPTVTYYERDPSTGDKEIRKIDLEGYISSMKTERLCSAPSFTCYTPHSEKKSLLVDFIQTRMKRRAKYKNMAIPAKAKGDMEMFTKYNLLQQVMKRDNNSVSGLLTVRGSELYDYSAHYTLTSTTRSLTAIGNATTERMVAGNRYYSTPDSVIIDISMSILYKENQAIADMVNRHNLHKPTPDEVMSLVLKSSRKYWKNMKYENKIYDYIKALTPEERAIFSYAGDLYHFRNFNPTVMKQILQDLSRKYTGLSSNVEDIKNTDHSIVNLVSHILLDELKGKGTNYAGYDPQLLDLFASTCIGVTNAFEKYKDILYPICSTPHLPINSAYLPTMVREATLLSDTDSTCGTYQEWVMFYNDGKLVFTPESTAMAAAVMTITTQTMSHNHKLFSAGMGVEEEFKETLAMKNEFTWSVMTPANVSKHYYAYTAVQEGNVYKEQELELKGVHLIASKIPDTLTNRAHDMMIEICNKINTNQPLQLRDYLERVKNIEEEIIRYLKAGHPDFLNFAKIKDPEEYLNNPASTPYFGHMFWEEVFAEDYQHANKPPYICVKFNTVLTNITALREWIDSIENKRIQNKLSFFVEKYKKKQIPTIYLDIDIIVNHGVPKEIASAIDYRKVTLDMCKVFYIILETLGYYKPPNMLVSDRLN